MQIAKNKTNAALIALFLILTIIVTSVSSLWHPLTRIRLQETEEALVKFTKLGICLLFSPFKGIPEIQ